MVQKYKHKAIIVDAVQLFFTDDCLHELQDMGLKLNIDRTNKNLPILKVPTAHGTMIATDGDYIIKNKYGMFYPYRANDFLDTYEKAE